MNNLESIKMRFGIYKGLPFSSLPIDYMKFLIDKKIAKGKLLLYCQHRLDLPKVSFRVIVRDSANGKDGEYVVKAYNRDLAMKTCCRLHDIQSTQSFHGTGFNITRLKNETNEREC